MSRSVFEHAILSGANLHIGAKHSDGTFPHNFWVSGNGNDGAGNGSWDNPYLTIRRAIRQAIDGRGDRILVMPKYAGYTETIDIVSAADGSSAGGNTNGGYAKRNLQIIGDDTTPYGIVQIIGDGSTASPTIRVQGDSLRGFVLKNVELDTNSLTPTQPALCLVTDDAVDTGTANYISNSYRCHIENVRVESNDPDTGVLLQGASHVTLKNLVIAGVQFGVSLTGSNSNFPVDVYLENCRFFDNVTADIATVAGHASSAARGTIATIPLTDVQFWRMRFEDRGGTPVTNYVNMQGTCINVHFFDFWAARDVADGTLMQLPANVVAIGHSAGGVESIIGA